MVENSPEFSNQRLALLERELLWLLFAQYMQLGSGEVQSSWQTVFGKNNRSTTNLNVSII